MNGGSESKTPLVAVIVRTKDRPLLLERAIQSVTGQTMDDWIMVIVNDGGDPETVNDLVSRYKLEGRAKAIHNKSSTGMWTAANTGIKAVDSRYIILHDDDDSWEAHFLEKTTAYLEQTHSNGVITATDRVDEDISSGSIVTLGSSRLYPGLKVINLYEMCAVNYAAPISFIYRRSALDKVGYYDEASGSVGDWDFAIRFIAAHDIDYLDTPEALAYYHHRPQTGGTDGNVVYTAGHRASENLLLNKYLREDIAKGKLGLGYIVNSLRKVNQDQHRQMGEHSALIAKVAEGEVHIRRLEERVSDLQKQLSIKYRTKQLIGKVKR